MQSSARLELHVCIVAGGGGHFVEGLGGRRYKMKKGKEYEGDQAWTRFGMWRSRGKSPTFYWSVFVISPGACASDCFVRGSLDNIRDLNYQGSRSKRSKAPVEYYAQPTLSACHDVDESNRSFTFSSLGSCRLLKRYYSCHHDMINRYEYIL